MYCIFYSSNIYDVCPYSYYHKQFNFYPLTLSKDETSVVKHAIKGMLPKNKLGRAILKNCHIYTGTEHGKEAQKPQQLNLNDLK